jgi:hypothetical protein
MRRICGAAWVARSGICDGTGLRSQGSERLSVNIAVLAIAVRWSSESRRRLVSGQRSLPTRPARVLPPLRARLVRGAPLSRGARSFAPVG